MKKGIASICLRYFLRKSIVCSAFYLRCEFALTRVSVLSRLAFARLKSAIELNAFSVETNQITIQLNVVAAGLDAASPDARYAPVLSSPHLTFFYAVSSMSKWRLMIWMSLRAMLYSASAAS